MPRTLNYQVYVPIKVSSSDAFLLDAAAEAQRTTRSGLLRQLIRSLDLQQTAKTAS